MNKNNSRPTQSLLAENDYDKVYNNYFYQKTGIFKYVLATYPIGNRLQTN